MAKRKDLLDILRECILGKKEMPKKYKHINEQTYKQVINYIHDYYKLNDIETGLNHAYIFSMLYKEDVVDSFDLIAQKSSIALYSLNRYRKKYNEFAKSLIEQEFGNEKYP